MSFMEIHLIELGVPAALTLVLWLLIGTRKGPHPATYKMSQPWTHPSILWAATDEPVGEAGHGHGASECKVGGGASGTW